MQSKNATGNLINRYKAVLKKCILLNVFGSLAIAGVMVLGSAGLASAAPITVTTDKGLANATASDDVTLGADVSLHDTPLLAPVKVNKLYMNNHAIQIDNSPLVTDELYFSSTGRITGVLHFGDDQTTTPGGAHNHILYANTIRSTESISNFVVDGYMIVNGRDFGMSNVSVGVGDILTSSSSSNMTGKYNFNILKNLTVDNSSDPTLNDWEAASLNVHGYANQGVSAEFFGTEAKVSGDIKLVGGTSDISHASLKVDSSNFVANNLIMESKGAGRASVLLQDGHLILNSDYTTTANNFNSFTHSPNTGHIAFDSNGAFVSTFETKGTLTFDGGGTTAQELKFSNPNEGQIFAQKLVVQNGASGLNVNDLDVANASIGIFGSGSGDAITAGTISFAGVSSLRLGGDGTNIINANLQHDPTSAVNFEVLEGTWKVAANKKLTMTKGSILIGGTLDYSEAVFDVKGVDAVNKVNINLKEGSSVLISNTTLALTNQGAPAPGATSTFANARISGNGMVVITGFAVTKDSYTAYQTQVGQMLAAMKAPTAASGYGIDFGADVVMAFDGFTVTGASLDDFLADEKTLGRSSVEAGAGNVSKDVAVGYVSGDGGANGINVANTGTLTITGDASDENGANKGKLSDANINVALGGTANLGSGTIGSDGAGKLDNKGIANIVGETKVQEVASTGDLNVLGGKLDTDKLDLSQSGETANIGSGNVRGELSTEELTMLGKTLLLDPAFQDGVGIEGASTGAITKFTSGAVDGNLIAGQNSYIVLGASDTAWAQKSFQDSGLVWGNGSSEISAALFINSPQTLAATGSIIVDGMIEADANGDAVKGGAPVTPTSKKAHFDENSLLTVNANGVGAEAALKGIAGDAASILYVHPSAQLIISGGSDGQVVTIVEDFASGVSSGNAGWGMNNSSLVKTDNTLTEIASVDASAVGKYTVTLKVNASTNPFLDPKSNQLLDEARASTSTEAGVTYLKQIINTGANGLGNESLKTQAIEIEGSRQLATIGASNASGLDTAMAVSGIITNYNSIGGTPLAGGTAITLNEGEAGLSAGSDMKKGIGVWFMPIAEFSSVDGMDSGQFGSGYNSNLYGASLGLDYTFASPLRVGMALSVGAGDIDSTGDFNSTENNFDFWGLSLYAGYQYQNLGLSADFGYSGISGDISQDTNPILGLGANSADTSTDVWTFGLNAEYLVKTSFADFIPYAGVRYMHVSTDAYDIKGNGGVMGRVSADSQSVWYFPLGVTMQKDFMTQNGWSLTPKADVGMLFATGDLEATSETATPGLATVTSYDMKNVDSVAFKGGLGIEARKNDFSMSFDYNIQASEHETSHGLQATFRYEF